MHVPNRQLSLVDITLHTRVIRRAYPSLWTGLGGLAFGQRIFAKALAAFVSLWVSHSCASFFAHVFAMPIVRGCWAFHRGTCHVEEIVLANAEIVSETFWLLGGW